MTSTRWIAAFLWLIFSAQSLDAAQPISKNTSERPRLVVVLVIDQFRADYLTRFENRFIPYQKGSSKIAGFEYLIRSGSYFPFAQYDILQSMTGPGHATILTGAYPYQMGIPINDWFDRDSHEHMYCAEDQSQATVGANPTDQHIGTSPKNLIASTFGDELKNAGYGSKVVSLAIKDRAAIMMGGHRADLAFWLDKESFQWASSRFYLPDGKLPEWIVKMNQSLQNEKGKSQDWQLSKDQSGLSTDQPYAATNDKNKSVGGIFPHIAKNEQGGISLPYGLELTVQAAQAAIQNEKLGQTKNTDVLAVSFSSHDYLGHTFGPNSREMEEMTVADDRAISELLNYLNKQYPDGLKNIVFVLTADHGIPPNPDWLVKNHVDAGRISQQASTQKIEDKLTKQYGKPHKNYIAYGDSFNFFFDQQSLSEMKVDLITAENLAKEILSKTSGIEHAFTSFDYENRKLPPGVFERQILHTYYSGRSGDVIAIPKPFYFEDYSLVTHMTGYNYDRTVPVIFAGPHIVKNKVFSNPAQVIDIAPTLSYLLKVLPPNMSEGRVLSEVLQ